MVINPSFWKDKKVLVTGHTGFKGSWLCLWLQKLGANLIGFSKSIPTKPSLFELANVEESMISIMGDVCDLNHLENVIKEYKPEIVIHMAAQSLVRESYKNPVETYATNVMGTVNLLEAIRRGDNVHVIINVTSDKCYENKNLERGYREDDPMGGYDPYSSSKGCEELVTASFRNSFFNHSKYQKKGIVLASVRSGNVIGGGDWSSDRLIPDIIKGIIEHRPIIIRNPHAIRPWQYVLEPLHGYLLLAEKLWDDGSKYVGGWNFGPNDEDIKSVSWIVEKLLHLCGSEMKWTLDESEHPHEEKYLKLDCSKAKSRLGWNPKTNLELALESVMEWYKEYEQKSNMRKVTEKQIERFNLI